MARLIVHHDTDPALFVQLAETDDDEPSWDGPCSAPGCPWTATEGGTRHTDRDEAVEGAMVHLDYHH